MNAEAALYSAFSIQHSALKTVRHFQFRIALGIKAVFVGEIGQQVVHLGDQLFDAADEEVVKNRHDDRDRQAAEGVDHGFVDAGGKPVDIRRAGGGGALKGLDHAADRADQTQQRGD